MINVYNFSNVHAGDGGELEVKLFEVSVNSDIDDVFCLIEMLEIGEEVKYGKWIEGNCEEEWKGVFDYNGDIVDSEEMDEYVEEFEEKKREFLSKRLKNEKMMRGGCEYDDGMIFVENDRIDEVVEILEKIKLKYGY
jgi:hypothetical protein